MTRPPGLRIGSPCHEDWEAMAPTAHGRHCATCAKTVIDVAGMSPGEARHFLALLPERIARGDRVCVQAHTTADGRLRGASARRYLLTNGMAAILAMSAFGCAEPAKQNAPDAGSAMSARPSGAADPIPASDPLAAPTPDSESPRPVPQPMRLRGEVGPAMPKAIPETRFTTWGVAVYDPSPPLAPG